MGKNKNKKPTHQPTKKQTHSLSGNQKKVKASQHDSDRAVSLGRAMAQNHHSVLYETEILVIPGLKRESVQSVTV